MRSNIALILSFCLVVTGSGCSVNVLENFAVKTSNEALYNDAYTAMNLKDYAGALTKIGLMTGEFPALRKVVKLKAEANAGLCGLEFLPFIQAMKDMGTTTMFTFLMQHFSTGTTAKIDYCRAAENLIRSIGTVTERTSDENMDLLLISFAKIGNVLSYYADADDNGTVDVFNPCTIGGGTRTVNLIDASDAAEVGTGLTLAIEAIQGIGSSDTLDLDALGDVETACSSLPPGYDFCSITDHSAMQADATALKGVRSFIKESVTIGLGTCTGDVSTCFCL